MVISTNVLTENRLFWETVKPILIDKTKTMTRVTLIEGAEVIVQNSQVVKNFNGNFINIPVTNMPANQSMNALIQQMK